MSKGLDELREIELKWQYGVFTFVPDFEIIEKELKDYQELKEQYEILKKELSDLHERTLRTNFEDAKKLTALEIIKNKEIDVKAFNDLTNFEEYNYYCSPELTSDEYDLLKEILR